MQWRTGWEGGREGADRDRGSGEVQGKFFFFFFLPRASLCRKAKLLPYLGIHPSSYPSCLVVLCSLSFHSSFQLFSLCGTSHFFFSFLPLPLSLIPALVAAFGPAGWHGAGWQCLSGSSLWAGYPCLSGSPALRWSRTSRSRGLGRTCHAKTVSFLLEHHCCRPKGVRGIHEMPLSSYLKKKKKKKMPTNKNFGWKRWNKKVRKIGQYYWDWFMRDKVI